ncbi:rod shape-determining protein MreC [Flavobacterium hibisci]|uniref:rod shape-determining protein MreC n=1 Tax=Flavobacterium hibisci TaxID=1914462 RepID=UPI001CC1407B|nr:rod shape-determining protein MreC [Flavobacterium hibisci]MBZ4042602.1 rod shape-determining protein MreC [Flavobacterium hibisci]
MRRILNFLYNNTTTLLFLLLLGISLGLTIQSHSYHKSKVIGVGNLLSDSIYKKIDDTDKYIKLVNKNDSLAQENAKLLTILFNRQENIKEIKVDSIFGIQSKNIVVSKVIRNIYNLQHNQLTINSGANDSVKIDMGVINNLGIVGVINNVSPNYGVVTSILNRKSLINAKIKNSNYFGTLSWNGESTGFVQLTDIPRTMSIKKGDTVVTGGISEIFPENIDIGTVDKISNESNSFVLNIKLFNDMTNLGYVYVLKNKNLKKSK